MLLILFIEIWYNVYQERGEDLESKKISLQDIADRAHVSKGLVSKVINNRPVRVSDQKREEILRIAADLDYEPSGQVLKCAPIPTMNKTIGVILPDLRYGFMGLLADTITKIAYENGYSVLMFNSKEDRALEQRYLDLCSTLHVAGIILDSRNSASSTGNLERLTQQSIPIVFVDCYPYNSVHSVVSSRNREYMFKLTESLIQRGHKQILSIVQDSSALTNVSMERIKGYYDAMDKYGLFGYNEIIYPKRDYQEQPVYTLMNSSIEFTAFIIQTASDVHHFIRLVPYTKYKDIASYELGVFDDFDVSFSEMQLGSRKDVLNRIVSVVAQRPKEIAEKAVHNIITQIKRGSDISPVRILVDCDLYSFDKGGLV